MNKKPVIEISGLSKSYDNKRVVNDINLSIHKGEVVGFLGPNGSGKTTTMRMICGLIKPDAGRGTCLGYDIFEQRDHIKTKTGYMTQKFSLYDDLTIRENLEFVARAYALPEIKKKVDKTLEDLGLVARQHQLTKALSGGWKQRLALAASIMHEPELLLLDEPTAGVDPKARRDFWDQIHVLAQQGLTVLVSTHYMDEAERCGRIAYILNGQMIDMGSIDEVIARANLYTWIVKGPNLSELGTALRGQPDVAQVSYFGNALHVNGPNRAMLKKAVTEVCGNQYSFSEGQTSLEDVFIHHIDEKEEGK